MSEKGVAAEARAVIRPSGRFTFASHREFRNACKGPVEDPAVREIQIDLGQVDYIDSSSLGMLLLLRENATTAGKTVSISNTRGVVRQVLDIANFERLFDIR